MILFDRPFAIAKGPNSDPRIKNQPGGNAVKSDLAFLGAMGNVFSFAGDDAWNFRADAGS
ncbi:MAG: hypothetical protein R3274_10775 [Desulfobacterales bacterium]|nr:hypothetical protein [Desulfobacterales bacterium]